MKPVLLATDGSPTAEKATDTAIELAQLLETELVVASVWSLPYAMVGFAPAPDHADLAKLGDEEARTVALSAAARAKEQVSTRGSACSAAFPSRKSASRPRGSTLVSS